MSDSIVCIFEDFNAEIQYFQDTTAELQPKISLQIHNIIYEDMTVKIQDCLSRYNCIDTTFLFMRAYKNHLSLYINTILLALSEIVRELDIFV